MGIISFKKIKIHWKNKQYINAPECAIINQTETIVIYVKSCWSLALHTFFSAPVIVVFAILAGENKNCVLREDFMLFASSHNYLSIPFKELAPPFSYF